MKTPAQFSPLLKQMLGLYRVGPIPLLLWFLSYGIVVYLGAVDSPEVWMGGRDVPSEFASMQFALAITLWFLMFLISTPLPFQLLGGYLSLEFLFTRAVDRAVWLRTSRIALAVIVVTPLLINCIASPWEREMTLEPASTGTPAADLQSRYIATFPGSHVADVHSNYHGQLVIPHGMEMYGAWLLWSALVAIFLVAGYFSIVFTAWQKTGWHHTKSRWRPWLGGVMIYAPTFSVVPIFLFSIATKINPYEECFLCFAANPWVMVAALVLLILVVEPLSERNIKKLEFEFF